jgi:phage head maturation protease
MGDLIHFGETVRETAPGVVSGLLLKFNTPDTADLYDTVFSKSTDYMLDEGLNIRVMYKHGRDKTLGRSVLGIGTLRMDEVGLWVDAQIKERDKYESAIKKLIADGKLGWSSATSEHLYEARRMKKKNKFGRQVSEILSWGIVEASLTPSPAGEDTGAVYTMREFMRAEDDATSDSDESGNMYENAIAKYTPSRWELESTLCKLVEQIAMMARMAQQTGGEFDYEAKVEECLVGYHKVMKFHVVNQISDWLKVSSLDESGRFYLRSFAIEDTDLTTHTRSVADAVTDVLTRYRGRRANRGKGRSLNNSDAERLTTLRTALAQAVNASDEILTGAGKEAPGEESSQTRDDLRSKTLRLQTGAAQLGI